MDKSSGNFVGKINFTLDLKRDRLLHSVTECPELSISILVGTIDDGILLSQKTEVMPIHGFKSKSVCLGFDSRRNENSVIVRVICEDIRSNAVDYNVPLDTA
jgi:hypothetical protein